MKTRYALLVCATFALALLAPPPSEAASIAKPGSGGSQWRGGAGHGSGNHGNWSGRGAWNHGGRHGGHRHHWRPWWGFYAAAPFVFGSAFYYSSWDPYWGYWGPRYYGYAYYPRSYPRYYEDEYVVSRPREQDLGPPSEINPSAPGAPTQGPLYMNYCPAAKAYYPKVTSCPEGWEFRRPNYRD